MTIAELADGAERLLVEVRALAAKHRARNAYWASLGVRERATKFPPSGCLYCDIGERDHGRQWTFDPDNWHTYTPPTTDQIKTRMLARRYGSAADAQNTNTEK